MCIYVYVLDVSKEKVTVCSVCSASSGVGDEWSEHWNSNTILGKVSFVPCCVFTQPLVYVGDLEQSWNSLSVYAFIWFLGLLVSNQDMSGLF